MSRAGRHRRAGADDARALRRPRRARRAVLRDGAGRTARRRTARRPSSSRSAPSARRDRRPRWSTCSPRCTRSTRRRSGSPTSAGPEGFLDRQVRRWGKQLEASRTRELPGADELHRPADRARAADEPAAPAIVHGDYRLDNAAAPATDDRITAVLDWEMATLGDPLHRPRAAARLRPTRGARPAATCVSDVDTAPGLPRRRAQLAALRRGAAAATLGDMGWYLAFALLQARRDPRGHPLPLPAGPDRRRGLRPDRRTGST